ncbi:alpha/beta hydrolase [Nocardia colli]|uniref:alpha/beta hydrolase n=1 Tax=Nocardia colli TaxID=2545717 RepID=UPI0035DBEE74
MYPVRHPMPRGRVLVLTGGKVSSRQSSRPWHLSRVRTAALAMSLRRRLGPEHPIHHVHYRFRGWNSPELDALNDADRVLRELTAHDDGRPTYLVGHSMGARVAAHLAAIHDIAGIVALAPWWPDHDTDFISAGCRILVMHGTADRWTDPESSCRQVVRAQHRGLDATWTAVPDAGHFMLHRPFDWHRRTAEFIADTDDRRYV